MPPLQLATPSLIPKISARSATVKAQPPAQICVRWSAGRSFSFDGGRDLPGSRRSLDRHGAESAARSAVFFLLGTSRTRGTIALREIPK